MKLTGEFTVKAPREKVFAAMRDARFFASCIDGVHDLNEVDETHYTAVFETKVAYMKFKFNVTVELTRVAPPDEIEAKVEGVPLGVVGRLTARSATRLVEAGDETKVQYESESALTGKLGSIGQPVLRAKAKQMEKQFASRLQAAFAAPEGSVT
jgi:carbon monoxide dehydrogenase subunit G